MTTSQSTRGRVLADRGGRLVDIGADAEHIARRTAEWRAEVAAVLAEWGDAVRPAASISGTLEEYMDARGRVEVVWVAFAAQQRRAAGSREEGEFHADTELLLRRYHALNDSTAFYSARAGFAASDLIDDAVCNDRAFRRHILPFALERMFARAARRPGADGFDEERSRVLAFLKNECLYRVLEAGEHGEAAAFRDAVARLKALTAAAEANASVWGAIAGPGWTHATSDERLGRIPAPSSTP